MLTCTVLPNADLKVTADNATRAYIADAMRKERGYWTILSHIFEPYSCNGSYTPFDAGDGDPFVGLTSAPCIAECMHIADDGKKSIEGRFWWHPDYAIINELEELRDKGRFVFTYGGREDE